jgi:hypothetical protein
MLWNADSRCNWVCCLCRAASQSRWSTFLAGISQHQERSGIDSDQAADYQAPESIVSAAKSPQQCMTWQAKPATVSRRVVDFSEKLLPNSENSVGMPLRPSVTSESGSSSSSSSSLVLTELPTALKIRHAHVVPALLPATNDHAELPESLPFAAMDSSIRKDVGAPCLSELPIEPKLQLQRQLHPGLLQIQEGTWARLPGKMHDGIVLQS